MIEYLTEQAILMESVANIYVRIALIAYILCLLLPIKYPCYNIVHNHGMVYMPYAENIAIRNSN